MVTAMLTGSISLKGINTMATLLIAKTLGIPIPTSQDRIPEIISEDLQVAMQLEAIMITSKVDPIQELAPHEDPAVEVRPAQEVARRDRAADQLHLQVVRKAEADGVTAPDLIKRLFTE